MRSVRRSAEDDAELAATPADIRLWVTFPGEITAKRSCITLPIAPTGVVSVSPVARQATIERMNDIPTAIRPAHQLIWKAMICTSTIAIPIGIRPRTNQEFGTSIAAMRCSMSPWTDPAWGPRRSRVKERATVFHWSPRAARLANTMTDVPPHSAQFRGW